MSGGKGGLPRLGTALALLPALALTLAACREEGRASGPVTSLAPAEAAPDTEELCRNARAFVAQVLDLARPDVNTDGVRRLYEDLEGFLRRVSELAPDHLRPTAALAVSAVSEFRASLATVGYDLARVDPSAWAKVNSPEFSTAVGELADYSRRTCGLPS